MVAYWLRQCLVMQAESLPDSVPVNSTTLPEPVRQVAYMALLGIALLGMLMIVATLLGGHWVRRWGDSLRRRSLPPDVLIPRSTKSSRSLDPDLPNDGETFNGNDTTVM